MGRFWLLVSFHFDKFLLMIKKIVIYMPRLLVSSSWLTQSIVRSTISSDVTQDPSSSARAIKSLMHQQKDWVNQGSSNFSRKRQFQKRSSILNQEGSALV